MQPVSVLASSLLGSSPSHPPLQPGILRCSGMLLRVASSPSVPPSSELTRPASWNPPLTRHPRGPVSCLSPGTWWIERRLSAAAATFWLRGGNAGRHLGCSSSFNGGCPEAPGRRCAPPTCALVAGDELCGHIWTASPSVAGLCAARLVHVAHTPPALQRQQQCQLQRTPPRTPCHPPLRALSHPRARPPDMGR